MEDPHLLKYIIRFIIVTSNCQAQCSQSTYTGNVKTSACTSNRTLISEKFGVCKVLSMLTNACFFRVKQEALLLPHTGVVEKNSSKLSGVSNLAKNYCPQDRRVLVACNPEIVPVKCSTIIQHFHIRSVVVVDWAVTCITCFTDWVYPAAMTLLCLQQHDRGVSLDFHSHLHLYPF